MNTTTLTSNDYKIIKREVKYQGVFRLVVNHVNHRKFNGEWSETFTREILERRSAVAVLLYDPKLDQVVLIEQFRAGACGSGQSPWLVEIVAGVYDETEEPDQVAIREAEEEAGATVVELEPICEYFVSPGGTNEYIRLYCGRVDASNLGGIHGLPEEHEDIRAFTLSTQEAFALLKQGKVRTSPVIITLQWLQLNYERLRAQWLK